MIVPPVPTEAINISTLPSRSSIISFAVVVSCIAGLEGFSNCCGINALPYSTLSSSALAIAPFIPSLPCVSTTFAPSAVTIFLLSTLMVSGIVRISCNPFEAHTPARPIPVLPLVGSIITVCESITPCFIPSSIIAPATRSLTLPSGLKYSSFAIKCASNSLTFS